VSGHDFSRAEKASIEFCKFLQGRQMCNVLLLNLPMIKFLGYALAMADTVLPYIKANSRSLHATSSPPSAEEALAGDPGSPWSG
jgi:hypothetical protein